MASKITLFRRVLGTSMLILSGFSLMLLKAQEVTLLRPSLTLSETRESYEETLNQNTETSIPAEEKQALVDIYNNCDGENWSPSWNRWDLSKDPSEWKGVTIKDGHVTELKIQGQKVKGEIPSSIGNLKELQLLYCSSNQISKFPDELFTLPKLREFYADLQNRGGEKTLKQEFPKKVNLPELETLYLADNEISGSLPADINLPKLKTFGMQNNKMTGDIPEVLAQCPSLQFFYVFGNDFTGKIPQDWSACTNLIQIIADNNKNLGGNFPASFTDLPKLQSISLQWTAIEGEIPSTIGNLTGMTDLLLTGSKMGGKIPENIGACTSLVQLALGECRFEGPIPEAIGTLTNLVLFQLTGNNIGGGFPLSLCNLPQLQDLRLAKCGLTGEIPAEMFPSDNTKSDGLKSLKNLDLSFNELSGVIPQEIQNCSTLTRLWLSGNHLDGNPCGYFTYENFPRLIQIEIADNKFTGIIEGLLTNPERVLSKLDISDNDFYGPLLPEPSSSDFGVLMGFMQEGVFVEGNRFTFVDFTNFLNALEENSNADVILTYAPQKPTTEDTSKEVKEGVGLVFDASLEEPDDWQNEGEKIPNKYQWYKDGSAISGATNAKFEITSFKASDVGTYHCTIKNIIAPRLTLKTGNFVVTLATNAEQLQKASFAVERIGETLVINGASEIALYALDGTCITSTYGDTLSIKGVEEGCYIITAVVDNLREVVKYML